MELNQIQLNNDLLQALYKHVLVLDDTTQGAPPPTSLPANTAGTVSTVPEAPAAVPASPTVQRAAAPAGPVNFLGKNQRNFTVLVHYPGIPYLPDEAFTFLGNVLNACQLHAADIAIVNTATAGFSLATVTDQLQPRQIIAFGLPANVLSAMTGWKAAQSFAPVKPAGAIQLGAPALEAFYQQGEASRPLKKQLWESLKQILGI
ncbi:hypothetical protein [Flavihumibacter petaseus]|uniref:Uncharacterized protein n=1 Tax=Flavihumibacter petaseus NBRC 106054 TaxID=1220578 RepID=A0A0E9N3D9_9BACT|nr:hypothetical protein [Flavihumibacter petaseus]GAO44191.1 hypothetical protein FPE01S_03_02290 [Flavihumibacter petaseus NBRC 106054]